MSSRSSKPRTRSSKASTLQQALGDTPRPARSSAPPQQLTEFTHRGERHAPTHSPKRRAEGGARMNVYLDPGRAQQLRQACLDEACSMSHALDEGATLWLSPAVRQLRQHCAGAQRSLQAVLDEAVQTWLAHTRRPTR